MSQLVTNALGNRWLLIGIAAALVFGAGYLIGTVRSGVSIHSGMASSAEGAIGIEADGWTYGIPLDVRWEDRTGTFHYGGRPACLPPSDEPVGPITFAAVEVSVGSSTWRQVVWVSCREAPPP